MSTYTSIKKTQKTVLQPDAMILSGIRGFAQGKKSNNIKVAVKIQENASVICQNFDQPAAKHSMGGVQPGSAMLWLGSGGIGNGAWELAGMERGFLRAL